MKTPIPKSHTRAQTRINPAWVTAPYRVDFFVCGVPWHLYKLSRKRARHQLRQYIRSLSDFYPISQIHFRKRWIRRP